MLISRNAKGFGRFIYKVYNYKHDQHISFSSASLAFFLGLGLFPSMIFLIGTLSLLPLGPWEHYILDWASGHLPREAFSLVSKQWLRFEKMSALRTTLLPGLLGLWAGSSAVSALMEQINFFYGRSERRSFLKQKIISLAVLIPIAFIITLSLCTIALAEYFKAFLPGHFLEKGLSLILWPVLWGSFSLIYYFAPSGPRQWSWKSPGPFLASIGPLLSSAAMKIYLDSSTQFQLFYGALTGPIILLLWFYLLGLFVLIGAKANAVFYKQGQRYV